MERNVCSEAPTGEAHQFYCLREMLQVANAMRIKAFYSNLQTKTRIIIIVGLKLQKSFHPIQICTFEMLQHIQKILADPSNYSM